MTRTSDSNARPEPPPAAAKESLAERRRRLAQRRRARRGAAIAAVGILALAGAGWATLSSGKGKTAQRQPSGRDRSPAPASSTRDGVRAAGSPSPPRVEQRLLGTLAAPLSGAAGAAVGGRLVLAGGLTASTASVDAIQVLNGGRATLIGRLPGARHDAAAVAIGGALFLFGGGSASEIDEIVRIDPASGRSTIAGRLPSPNSDSAAATIGGTAYIVGGYTGTAWLDSIVEWRPGRSPRIVARLPQPLRYAAVASVGGRLIVAGGSLPSGVASRAVLVFDPATGRVRSAGSLPAPTTHAAAAAIGAVVYVIGGRGTSTASLSSRIVSVDTATGRIADAGTLDVPTSDIVALSTGKAIVLAGGRGPTGAVATLSELRVVARVAAATTARSTPVTVTNVYARAARGMLSPTLRSVPPRIYVPESGSNTVAVIDPATYTVIDRFAAGIQPQHITPSYDLKTLYVLNNQGYSLTPIDPLTGRPRRTIPVIDPYNLYFTLDGRYSIVVAEAKARLDFSDPHTFELRRSLPVPCRGVDHLDFTADGRFLLASCEFSGQLVVVDVRRQTVVKTIALPGGPSQPQDVRLAADGRVFYVADMRRGGLWIVAAKTFRIDGFLPTGKGAHGLYFSRDARVLYVSNRDEGTVSVVDVAARRVVATWRIPGGSPDMGGVSTDGRVLWLTGRYNSEVYAIDTRAGRLLARIRVGRGPHGLAVWPQPGRYSLGHTGLMR